jgi:hypothetical protein
MNEINNTYKEGEGYKEYKDFDDIPVVMHDV